MASILEFPEANIAAWLAFSGGLRAWFRDWPEREYDLVMQDVRPIFLSAYHSGNFRVEHHDVNESLRIVNTNITGLVAPLLIEIVRLKLELQQLRGVKHE